MKPYRLAWTSGFPAVSILASESEVKRHPAYNDAKAGQALAAGVLVHEMVADVVLDRLRPCIADPSTIVASVHAREATGVNAIPEALADKVARHLGLRTDASLVQTNVVNHTGADGFSRLSRQALFDGVVQAGESYLMVDDFIGQGGTLANFRGYIEAAGGIPLAAVVLTGKPYSATLALSTAMLAELRAKHGQLEDWWRERFGFGFEALTASEARYLSHTADADTIRGRIVAAQ